MNTVSLKKRYFIIFILIVFHSASFAQNNNSRPKIGITLSGGGAKGLAHIGLLQAIDSAGLKVDYVTGTSMGAIIGAMYAIGYSGKDIEAIGHQLNWDRLFSNQPELRNIIYEEKDEFNAYALEVPLVRGKLKLPSGVIEGEELWLTFAELFMPVYDIKDFSKFNIPFKCIATDVATGEAVVLDYGNIITATRASMSIPSVFTALILEDRKLIDGGVVRNFPVKDVKAMCADFVIGSNVSAGLQSANKLNSALDILYQIGSYKGAEDFKNERSLCDILVEPKLSGFSAASFTSADSIILRGKEAAMHYYPQIKHLADSLNALYPDQKAKPDRLPDVKRITLTGFDVQGLNHTTYEFLMGMLDLKQWHSYTSHQLSEAIRSAFGTRQYRSIYYELIPTQQGGAIMKITLKETPETYVKVALHYNTFTSVAAILNLTTRNFVTKNSRSLISLNLSENPKFRAEHFQLIGQKQKLGLSANTYFEALDLPIYDTLGSKELYRNPYFDFDVHLQYSLLRRMAFIGGTKFEYIKYTPSITQTLKLEGHNRQFYTYVGYKFNSLNRNYFPSSGLSASAEFGIVYHQRPAINITSGGNPVVNPDSAGLKFNRYERLLSEINYFIPTTKRSTVQIGGTVAASLNKNRLLLNEYKLGGIYEYNHYQFAFVGLKDAQIQSTEFALAKLGFQYELFKDIYAIANLNAGIYDYVNRDIKLSKGNILTGYGITLGYYSAIGPMSVTLMRCDQVKATSAQVNIGFHF